MIQEELPTARVAVLSGPSHAEEVARRMPTTVTVSAEDMAVAAQVQIALSHARFRIYLNSDLVGVELGGALKNVIALCAGIVDGIGMGDNTKAALMTRGISEIARLGMAMGADADTFYKFMADISTHIAIDKDGFLGIFKGGFSASAVGISAALIFSYLASLICDPKMKK